MSIGPETPPIANPHPDSCSLLDTQWSRGVVRSNRQLHCGAWRPSVEERLSQHAMPFGWKGYLRIYRWRCLIRRRFTTTTSTASNLRRTPSSTPELHKKTYQGATQAFVDFECRFFQLSKREQRLVRVDKVLLFVKSIGRRGRMAIKLKLEEDDNANGLIEDWYWSWRHYKLDFEHYN